MEELPTTARPCPTWCTGEHDEQAFGVQHRGARVKVITHRTSVGGALDYVSITPMHLIPNTDAPTWFTDDGPQVRIYGSLAESLRLSVRDADRLAMLQAQLGNTEVADAIRGVVAVVCAEDERQDDECVRPAVPGTYPGGEPQAVRDAADNQVGGDR